MLRKPSRLSRLSSVVYPHITGLVPMCHLLRCNTCLRIIHNEIIAHQCPPHSIRTTCFTSDLVLIAECQNRIMQVCWSLAAISVTFLILVQHQCSPIQPLIDTQHTLKIKIKQLIRSDENTGTISKQEKTYKRSSAQRSATVGFAFDDLNMLSHSLSSSCKSQTLLPVPVHCPPKWICRCRRASHTRFFLPIMNPALPKIKAVLVLQHWVKWRQRQKPGGGGSEYHGEILVRKRAMVECIDSTTQIEPCKLLQWQVTESWRWDRENTNLAKGIIRWSFCADRHQQLSHS